MDIYSKNDIDKFSLSMLLTYLCDNQNFNQFQFLQNDETKIIIDGKDIVGVKDIALHFAGAYVSSDLINDKISNKVIKLLDFRDTLVPAITSGEKNQILPIISKFNKSLDYSVYVVGNTLSLADLVLFPCFYSLLISWNEVERGKYDNITRWYDHLQHLPSLIGRIDFLAIQIDPNLTQPTKKDTLSKKNKEKTSE